MLLRVYLVQLGALSGTFDTALTLSQAKQDVVMKQLMRGAFTKAVTVGLFSICYKSISQVLMGVEKKENNENKKE